MRQQDILAAEELGADFIGFVFVPSSLRCISFDEAKDMRAVALQAKTVGVFADHSNEKIEKHAEKLNLDFIQLHGKPDIDRIKHLSKPVIQAFCGIPDVSIAEIFLTLCPYILIDKAEGEDEADFDTIAQLPLRIRSKLFLAGGLTPENVRVAADRIQPFAVDSARGIESSPGKKNHHRMFAFLHALSS